MNKLFLVCGLPGVGKTTVAKTLAKEIKGKYFNIDKIKRKLLSKKEYKKHLRLLKPWPTNLRIKAYKKIWPEILKSIRRQPIVLDELFHLEKTRSFILKMANKFKIQSVIIEIRAHRKMVRSWLERRNIAKNHPAEIVPFGMYQAVKKIWQPIDKKHFIIYNSGDKKHLLKIIEKKLLKNIWSKEKRQSLLQKKERRAEMFV